MLLKFAISKATISVDYPNDKTYHANLFLMLDRIDQLTIFTNTHTQGHDFVPSY